MAKVFVVGASGPIGRAAANELTAQGYNVKRLSRSGSGDSDRLDVTDRRQTRPLLKRDRPDTVVYLARPELADPSNHKAAVNAAVDSLREFATQCHEQGVQRIVFASSAALYGTDSEAPLREVDATHALSAYAELKWRSEQVLNEISSASSLSTVALRLFNVYGAGLSKSLVNRLAIRSASLPLVYNTDTFVRDYIHVTDVARAVGFAVSSSTLASPVMNVGTGIGTSNKALLALFPLATYTESPTSDLHSFSVANISLIKEAWGFEPKVNLRRAAHHPEEFFHP